MVFFLKDIKNRCFNLIISEKELADLAFDGLRSYLKKELEGFEYHTVNYLHMKVLGLEFILQSAKDAHNTHRSIHVDCKSDSDDEKKEAYVAEFIWPSDAKPCLWQNHLNYPGSSALAITIKATPTQTHFKQNNSWYVG